MDIANLVLEFIKALIWPIVTLVLVFNFKYEIKDFLKRMRKANLPGNISFESFPEMIEEGKLLAETSKKELEKSNKEKKVSQIPLNNINTMLLQRNLKPSQSGLDFEYYRDIAMNDPNLALAGLRMELEVMANNLAVGFDIKLKRAPYGVGQLLRLLKDEGAVTLNQYELGITILKLCNKAVHGQFVTLAEAEEVIDISKVLADQYISWLSWGFPEQ